MKLCEDTLHRETAVGQVEQELQEVQLHLQAQAHQLLPIKTIKMAAS